MVLLLYSNVGDFYNYRYNLLWTVKPWSFVTVYFYLIFAVIVILVEVHLQGIYPVFRLMVTVTQVTGSILN